MIKKKKKHNIYGIKNPKSQSAIAVIIQDDSHDNQQKILSHKEFEVAVSFWQK